MNDVFRSGLWETATWDGLSGLLDEYDYTEFVGKTKPVEISGYGTFDFILVGKNASGYVFQSVPIITTHRMNSSNTTSGGWGSTEMRTWLNDTFYPAFADDVKGAIKSATVRYCTAYNSTSNTTCTDNLWLASYQEIFGPGSGNYTATMNGLEGTQFDYYANGGTKIKYNTSSSASYWWLRSVYSSTYFWSVSYSGYVSSNGASYSVGVAPCFCI
jgi:hypothetical protein